MQVGVVPRDRPSLRFLWREDPATDASVFSYVRHNFGSKDSPTCANYALERTARDNRKMFPEATKSVENKFYMDDYLESSVTIDEATKKIQDLVKMLSKGGFTSTKFVTNVPNIPNRLDPNNKLGTKTDDQLLAAADENSHFLGLKWNYRFDTLVGA